MLNIFDHKTFVADEIEREKKFNEHVNRSKNISPTPDVQLTTTYRNSIWREHNNNSPSLEPRIMLLQKTRAQYDEVMKELSTNTTAATCSN